MNQIDRRLSLCLHCFCLRNSCKLLYYNGKQHPRDRCKLLWLPKVPTAYLTFLKVHICNHANLNVYIRAYLAYLLFSMAINY